MGASEASNVNSGKIDLVGCELAEFHLDRLGVRPGDGSPSVLESRFAVVRRLVIDALPRRGVPASDLDDVTQVALVVLTRNFDGLACSSETEMAAYAAKVAIRFWRRQAKLAQRGREKMRDWAVHQVGVAPSPEDRVQARELLRLWVLFAPNLPEDVVAAIVACSVGGLSRAEAGRSLGVPIGTIHSRIRRARRLFGDWLHNHNGTRGR